MKARYIAKTIGQDLVKLTYPLTGNLSRPVKEKLEKVLGSEAFCTKDATDVSMFTNHIFYPYLGSLIGEAEDLKVIGGLVGFVYALIEWKLRKDSVGMYCKGSLAGGIISLPIQYCISVAERAGWNERRTKKKGIES